MAPLCDFCGEQRPMIYCQSDAACLCLSCDRNVHSANALSRRHTRTLLCDRCNTQPASVRCIVENVSLCPNCDRNGHNGSVSAPAHKSQPIHRYSGCPSAEELSRIWSFFREIPPVEDPNCEQGFGLMRIDENSVSDMSGSAENYSGSDVASTNKIGDLINVDKINPWIASSSRVAVSCTGAKDLEFCKDNMYEDFIMDGVDLTFENYEELLGVSHTQTEQIFDDAGIDSFFETKEMSAANSNYHCEIAAEVCDMAYIPGKPTHAACIKAVSPDSVMSSPVGKVDSSLCIPVRQARSSLSFPFQI
uniref:B box-type domain-containing protein n=1 Tax=Ananas comosus var. bracteatus TaxID=296719 RepID=A0A6V7QS54_ANACO